MADWARAQSPGAVDELLDVENKRLADHLASKVTRLKTLALDIDRDAEDQNRYLDSVVGAYSLPWHSCPLPHSVVIPDPHTSAPAPLCSALSPTFHPCPSPLSHPCSLFPASHDGQLPPGLRFLECDGPAHWQCEALLNDGTVRA
ncbi:BET1-like protein isoform X1 [Echinops telfairi]|uniref:BET1-like protein isoform X1 n=1 Tax=Echinops telfairi TaxID=9371 RepID=A0AC55D3Q3_ECHTE|nr:BET1-like protein isoform X1 [Echinops telfairi]